MAPFQHHLDIVFDYHSRTKHRPYRYARSLGYLDWAAQPNPFLRFKGASLHLLPRDFEPLSAGSRELFSGKSTPSLLTRESLSRFLFLSLAISAWKEIPGERWALRVNPSSGNLHPTEGYIFAPVLDGLEDSPALYHYRPDIHGFETRNRLSRESWNELTKGRGGIFFVGLSSIPWREAWKYGERAWRYCQLDAGHALAAFAFAAGLLGWRVKVFQMSGQKVSRLLGCEEGRSDPAEWEEGGLLVAVGTEEAVAEIGEPLKRDIPGDWLGTAERLSEDHVEWEVIHEISEATNGEVSREEEALASEPPAKCAIPRFSSARTAEEIIRARRSAVAFDREASVMKKADFRALLDCLHPSRLPWNSLSGPPLVHPLFFLHAVEGFPAGIYFMARSDAALERARGAFRKDYLWEKVEETPRLFLLKAGDFRDHAGGISCGQEIAADGAFAIAMLAEFRRPLETRGPALYPRLYQECGMLGQVLYLAAEASGLRGTGIGCFFDDELHSFLGLEDDTFQSLYHFTVGSAVDDPRLTTLPSYS